MSRTSHGTACPLDCPDACSLTAEVEDARLVSLEGSDANPLTESYICAKVRRLPEALYGADRILSPGFRDGPKGDGSFRDVSWDEALDRIAERMLALRDGPGAESILPLSYGGSNGALSQDTVDARLFWRLGASRLARTVCAVATGRAAEGLTGKMAGVAYPDYEHAQLIIVWGANPHASGIHLVPWIQRAQKSEARLVVVDPRRTKLARRANLHVAPRPGTDLALALALIRRLHELGAVDHDFLGKHTTGWDRLREAAEPWIVPRAAQTCGISREEIEILAAWYADSSPAVIRCGWGLERNRNGGSAAAAVLALPAVAGKFGVRGGGFTLSNSAVWDIDPTRAANADPPDTRIVNMNRVGRFLTGNADPPVNLLFVYNANPLTTLPHQELVRKGLEREDLFTVVFDSFRTDTARYADVVLPAAAFPERRELSRGYGVYALHGTRPVVPPAGLSRSNHEVFLDLVRRTGLDRPGDPQTEDEVAAAILEVNPHVQEMPSPGEVRQPAFGDRPVQFVDVFPRTPDGKVHLFPDELDRETPEGLYRFQKDPGTDRYPLALISPATDKTISSTLGQLVEGTVPLRMHPADAGPRRIKTGDRVRVHNGYGEVRCRAAVDPDVRVGVVELPKGLWARHTESGTTSNALSPDTLSDLGQNACFNDARVQVEPLG